MSPHNGSAHREDQLRHNEAVVEGVCLAIDELLAMGADATAEALFKRLFIPRPTSPAATAPDLREPLLP